MSQKCGLPVKHICSSTGTGYSFLGCITSLLILLLHSVNESLYQSVSSAPSELLLSRNLASGYHFIDHPIPHLSFYPTISFSICPSLLLVYVPKKA